MEQKYVSLLCGFLFALGLGISGMLWPPKIIGFLDIFGDWDPSLIFVMVGAILVHGISYQIIKKKEKPYFANQFHWPTSKDIDFKLMLGTALFGMGWAMSGFCPGPGVASLPGNSDASISFVVWMIIAMVLYNVYQAKVKKQ